MRSFADNRPRANYADTVRKPHWRHHQVAAVASPPGHRCRARARTQVENRAIRILAHTVSAWRIPLADERLWCRPDRRACWYNIARWRSNLSRHDRAGSRPNDHRAAGIIPIALCSLLPAIRKRPRPGLEPRIIANASGASLHARCTARQGQCNRKS